MKLSRILAVVAVAGSLGVAFNVGTGQAQIREQQPAEFPPTSYKGKQYVDSNGCVFIRAGIDGNVTWVPRVTRDRKTVCGFRPSLAGQVAEAPAQASTGSAPVQITLDGTASPAPTTSAKPAPRRVAAKPRRATPAVVRQTAPKRASAQRVIVKPTMAAPVVQARSASEGATACPGASPLSQQYLRGSGVRCGPQAEPIVAPRMAAAPRVVVPQAHAQVPSGAATIQPHSGTGYAAEVTSTTRIVPKHVAQNRLNTRNGAAPKGYRLAWDDDRLNPYRAEQNLAGREKMLLIWTQTVPRRLVNQTNGRDMTASVPLIYPYTSIEQQRREFGEVTIVQRDGQTMKRIVRHAGAKPVARKPFYSSRSTPEKPLASKAAASSKADAGKRYVQIGTFRDEANARRAAQSIARMGMPARIGKHRKGGQSYMTVQAGPFNGSGAMQSALNRLRGAGYRDAFAR